MVGRVICCLIAYLIGVFADKLDWKNETREGQGKKKVSLALNVFLTR
jgi:hypothetical protein